MPDSGIVYLVGAGPGNPELITVRGTQLLAQCEAVVYDRLSPLEWVVTLPENVERFYVGKASGRHTLPQTEVNELLARLALEGKKVVRLKGGDPFIFGRGGEEAIFLQEHGLPFEVVPGVTAGLAAGAYTGIPATHRGVSVFVMLLTAHETPDKDELQVPWDWIGQARGGTLIGYMGVKQLPQVVNNLVTAGLDPETPAAMIERATTGKQRVITSTISQLSAQVEAAQLKSPAAFIIGDTVELRKQIVGQKAGILAGKTVMVTRPAHQAKEMYRLLRGWGAEVLPLPTISVIEYQDEESWKQVTSWFETREQHNQSQRWLVFTSENGVKFFVDQLLRRGFDFRALGNFKIAAVGQGTSQELKRQRLGADFIPSKATTAVLANELAQALSGQPGQVLRVRGNLGDQTVEESLKAVGMQVSSLRVYSTTTARWDAGMWAALEENPPDVITFTSGSTVTGFCEILGEKRVRQVAQKAVIASIGPLTTQVLGENGFQVQVEAREHSISGLIQALVDYFHNNQ